MRILFLGQCFFGLTMTESILNPEIRELSQKIEFQTGQNSLSCQQAAKYCQCPISRIRSSINKGKLKAEGAYNKKNTPLALAMWMLGY